MTEQIPLTACIQYDQEEELKSSDSNSKSSSISTFAHDEALDLEQIMLERAIPEKSLLQKEVSQLSIQDQEAQQQQILYLDQYIAFLKQLSLKLNASDS